MNKIENAVIKYQIDFERYKNGQANEVIEMLDKANMNIAKFIKQTDGIYTKARYKEIAKKLSEVSKGLKENVEENIDIDGVIDYELKKQKKLLNESKNYLKRVKGGEFNFIYPSREQIKTAALFKPIDTKYGMTYQSYLEGIENGLYNVWDSAVRTGYLTGQSTQKVVSNVLGGITPKTKLIKQGMINSYRNSIYSNTRTVLQSFANETMNRVYEENEQYFGAKDDYKYEYLATLDSRTCIVCGSLDGKLYKSIKDAPELPQHRNCRCLIIPYFNIEGETRASNDGYTDKKTFSEWLENQDKETQMDVLGKTRYGLFTNGIEINQFVDDGKVLKLEDLYKKLGVKNIELYTDSKFNYIIPEKADFTDVEKAFKSIGMEMSEDIKNEDINAIKEVYNTLSKVHPSLLGFNKIGTASLDDSILMQTLPNGTLVLNEAAFTDLNQVKKQINEAASLPKNANLESTVMHEVGHGIERLICLKMSDNNDDFMNSWKYGTYSNQILQKAQKVLNLSRKEYLQHRLNISELAIEGENFEVMAECFDDYSANKSKADILSKKVVELSIDFLVSLLKGVRKW